MSARVPPAVPPARVFVGRDAELAEVVRTVRAGWSSGLCVVVRGEGGIGKTSLIDAAVAQLSTTHQVLRGAADAMDRRRAYGILLDALAPVLTADDRRVTAEHSEHVAGERLLSVIDAATREPTALVLEDLQWADAASLRLLARLARTLPQLPLVIVGSVRTQAPRDTAPELDQLLAELGGRALLHSVALAPLSPAASVELAERIIGTPVGDSLAHYTAIAGGNPLFLTEMIHTLLRDGALAIGPGGAQLKDAPVGPSPSLSIVIMRHLSQISAQARDLLGTAALLGTRFSAAQLRMVSDRQMSELLPTLREAFAAGFLQEIDSDTLGFRHELVQAVLLHDLPTPVRAELHREIARRLDDADAPAATVAGHLLRAPTVREDLAWMARLAQATAAAAPDTAVELWERVTAHTDPSDPMHVDATAGLARVALNAGRARDAGRLASSVLAYADTTPSGTALRNIDVRSLILQHRHDDAYRRARQYAASESLDPAERAAHLAFAGWPLLLLGDTDEALRLTTEGAAFAAAHGSPIAEANALTLQGLIANSRGDLDDAIALLARAVDLAEKHPSLAAIEAFQHASLAVALADVDRVDDSARMLQRSMQLNEQFGFRTGILITHTLAAQARSHSGSLPDIAAELEAHAALLGPMDIRLDPPVRGLRAHVIAMQRGPAAARDAAALVDPARDRQVWSCRGSSWIWRGHSQIVRAAGDAAATRELLWHGWQDLRHADLLMDCAELALDLARMWQGTDAAARADRDAKSAEVVAVVTALAAKNPAVAHLQATSLGVTGVVTGDADALIEAERVMAGTGRRLDHARFAGLAARALPARDGTARVLAETALRAYAEVGADHEVARTKAAFRRLGIAAHAPTRARPASGWHALTRTEERIAGHVAAGRTNPEIAQSLFISRRTVETHVSHILTKLGLRSRTELAVRFARRTEG